MAYNFQIGNNKLELLKEYGSVTEKVLFNNAVFATLMPGINHDVITRNGDCSIESNLSALVYRNKVCSEIPACFLRIETR
jgi:hypothetical protein